MLGCPAVGGLARCQQEGERSALAIGDGVDLGVASAPADADRLKSRPPFPPAAERCAFTCVLSISTPVDGPPAAASVSNTAHHTPLAALAHVAVVKGPGRPVDRRGVLPPAPRLEHVNDPADHPPVINLRHPARFVRQQRLQPRPLPVVQPELARHLALPITRALQSHLGPNVNPVYGSQP